MTPHRLTDRAFGLVLAAVFAVVTAIGWLAFGANILWPLAVSVTFLAIALMVPWLLLPLNCLWAAITARLGKALNIVLLGAFFYLLIMPVGFVLRLIGHDPMLRNADSRAKSYWTPVGRQTDEETLKDMF